MKKQYFMSLLTLNLVLLGGCVSEPNTSGTLTYDFEADAQGFTPLFSDYHDDGQKFESYEMAHTHQEIPVNNTTTKGLYIAGHNRSDDLFMGYVKELTNLEPETEYTFNLTFKFAPNVEGGLIGIGGAPGESVFVKSGLTNTKPEASLDAQGVYRLNIDAGHQSESGKDMQVIGDITKPMDQVAEGFVFKPFETTMTATTNESGSIYLIIATDSGFEGLTEYYLDDIVIDYSIAK